MADRVGRTELFHDWILEPRKRYPSGAGAGHTRKRFDDPDQCSDSYRRKFNMGLCAGNFFFVTLSFVRLVVLRRPLSRQLSAGADVPGADHNRTFMPGNSVREFRDGFQAG